MKLFTAESFFHCVPRWLIYQTMHFTLNFVYFSKVSKVLLCRGTSIVFCTSVYNICILLVSQMTGDLALCRAEQLFCIPCPEIFQIQSRGQECIILTSNRTLTTTLIICWWHPWGHLLPVAFILEKIESLKTLLLPLQCISIIIAH